MKNTILALLVGAVMSVGQLNAVAADVGSSMPMLQAASGVDVVTPSVPVQPVAYRYGNWRYRWYGNRWWYWTPNNNWVYWSGGAWTPYYSYSYQPYVYDYYQPYPYRYYTGYRGAYVRPYVYYGRPWYGYRYGRRWWW